MVKIMLKHRQMRILFIGLIFLAFSSSAIAQETSTQPNQSEDKPEAQTEAPLRRNQKVHRSDPKISTAAGVLGGYVHQFDEESPPSLFGVVGTYSTTDSWYAGVFGKVHFGEDKHRLNVAAITGEIRTDYSDFLGSGLDVQTTDAVTMFALRYAYLVNCRLFVDRVAF